ncbi:leucyl/phenylalanyl-tRNA--protein transferase [Marinomonas balearica]|uniref:Leucyl/phenylalanyl-tRNA--protein transferase n=1 Tax=Marinomonas balearica TaxID=491947 RepID=A0A4R6MFG0_9GAMM|nr:leucyl/phenylalanyl-tRNA--protein transferase [Marinomonas balearica]TDO99490.1 leucyl/phenylalanyl-tRNA--protein transferase [Marinomonas balearica]
MTQQNKPEKELLLLTDNPYDTPIPNLALDEPEGLAAVGGDLSLERLIHLYQLGFFPWYSDPDPILWWHPPHRCCLIPNDFHTSRSLKKSIKRGNWRWSINTCFETVIEKCSSLRAENEGTWISEDIKNAYINLSKNGYAFSFEVWSENELAGGFYGVSLGHVFFGESMFSLKPNASKVALKFFTDHCNEWGIKLIDCQVESEHLISLGAKNFPREEFISELANFVENPSKNTTLMDLSESKQKYLSDN